MGVGGNSQAHRSEFDHALELKDLQHAQKIEDQTFGNANSKRSFFENEELFKLNNEAVNGNAVGQENAIIRPSGSKTSFK